MGYNVAIDGPAGPEKARIAKLVSKRKGIHLCKTQGQCTEALQFIS